VLFPHLDPEVAEAMPVVSASITQAEWQAAEQEYNIKPKSLAQLGMEGHWLLDGIHAEAARWWSTRSRRCRGSSCCTVSRARTSVGPAAMAAGPSA